MSGSAFNRLEPSVYSRIARTGLRRDMMTRAAYSSDASIFRRVPAAVLEPKSADDVRDGLQIAEEYRWPVIGRGGGTSVAGNAIGDGLVIDTSRNFNNVISVDPDAKTAVVQPGVVCDHLKEEAAKYGLTYGPDPSTHSRCTVGGMVANNACGSHSVAWGTSAENLESIRLMLWGGREVDFFQGGCSDPQVEAKLRRFVAKNEALIRAELGRFPRQVSGYGLHYLLPEHGFDCARAVAGSEGTLGIITQLTVNLVEVPKTKVLAVLAFDTVFDAAHAAANLRLPGVTTIEGMGGDLLAALQSKVGQGDAGSNLPGRRNGEPAGGWLYCEVVGDTEQEALDRAEAVSRAVPTRDFIVVSDPGEMRDLWWIREASAGLVTRLPDGGEAWPNWEDSAVPPENLADYLRDLYALMAKHELRGIPFGHFGEGCIHVRISFDFGSESGLAVFHTFMEEAAALVSRYGGSLSGEHGDGRARSRLLGHMYSLEMLELFAQFKAIFDPDGNFNPGVLVAPDSYMDGLRMGKEQRTHEFLPITQLPQDKGSLVNAVNRCVGVSACRSDAGAMCPSFQITGDEVHSTRGRARLLSEMFRGESIEGGARNAAEVEEALDLCLSCKACVSECPVNVDMATYKSEFLNERYRGRLRPMAHYTMGWLPLFGAIAHKIPGLPKLIDATMRNSLTASLLAKAGGLETSRPLIRFSHTSLRKWNKKRVAPMNVRERVVLWPDSFNENLDSRPAQAAIEVLELLGFDVLIPDGFVCCGLTWHSTGQLSMSKRVLQHTAKVMKPYLDQGLPVIGIEPSCTTMLRTDAPHLLDDPDIARLARATVSFGEFVAPKLQAIPELSEVVTEQSISALTQVHCHERALGDASASAALLEALGVQEERIQTGCCGLAGNWGFEKGHGAMSMALGERELFPKAREAAKEGGIVIADGFSCRTHVQQGTGVQAMHTAEIVAEILRRKGATS